MAIAESRITSQGQISVPAESGEGSVLDRDPFCSGKKIVVKPAKKYTSLDIHRVLFPDDPPKRVSIEEMDEGIREYMRKKHARSRR